jgi:hypothetical protein
MVGDAQPTTTNMVTRQMHFMLTTRFIDLSLRPRGYAGYRSEQPTRFMYVPLRPVEFNLVCLGELGAWLRTALGKKAQETPAVKCPVGNTRCVPWCVLHFGVFWPFFGQLLWSAFLVRGCNPPALTPRHARIKRGPPGSWFWATRGSRFWATHKNRFGFTHKNRFWATHEPRFKATHKPRFWATH